MSTIEKEVTKTVQL